MEFKVNGYHETNLPALDAQAVTPSDTVDLPYYATSLWVGGVGNVTVVTFEGSVVTFTAVPAGTRLPIVCRRVNATLTTATLILALF